MLDLENQEFIPVLIGADIGTYSIARSFYLEYGIKSKTCSQEVLGAINNSKIIDMTTIPKLTKESQKFERASMIYLRKYEEIKNDNKSEEEF